MRSNKRRDLTSSQWAVLAVESESIYEEIRRATEEEAQKKRSENAVNRYTKEDSLGAGNLFPGANYPETEPDDYSSRATSKLANAFNTNSQYIKQAKRLKEQLPDQYKAIRTGEKSISEVEKERKILEKRAAIEERQRKAEEERAAMATKKAELIARPLSFPKSKRNNVNQRRHLRQN